VQVAIVCIFVVFYYSMALSSLTAISSIDGRYYSKTDRLSPYFSEFGLIKYRVMVEIEYFIALAQEKVGVFTDFPLDQCVNLQTIYSLFSETDALWIKEQEQTTNHDVKAVEYFVKHKLQAVPGMDKYIEFVHFGLTSQDINNTAIPLSIKDALEQEYFPMLNSLLDVLSDLKHSWKDVVMLARTHGQPASPTRLGKEIQVFEERIQQQVHLLQQIPFSAKFGGATGNFNAHFVAFPQHDWITFANKFVNDQLGLSRSQTTTQIDHYDHLAALFDTLKRINTIILDLDRDMWMYISQNYFNQQLKTGEVGSSAMPHKINPIDFENAEGNIGIANALLEHLSSKLPVSRLQRDLSDSTVLRNVGTVFAHTLIAIQATQTGLCKLLLNPKAIQGDLEDNWAVVAEAIQTILRRESIEKPYEQLKELTRTNEKITQQTLHVFIDNLQVNESIKNELKQISPHNYAGIQLIQ